MLEKLYKDPPEVLSEYTLKDGRLIHEFSVPDDGEEVVKLILWMNTLYDDVHLGSGTAFGESYCRLIGTVRYKDGASEYTKFKDRRRKLERRFEDILIEISTERGPDGRVLNTRIMPESVSGFSAMLDQIQELHEEWEKDNG